MLSTTGFGLPDYAKVEASASSAGAGSHLPGNHLVLTDGVVATLYLPKTPKTITLPVVKQPEPIPAKKTPPAAKKTVNLTVSAAPVVDGNVTKLYPDKTNNCVAFSKAETGIDRPLGNGARAGIQGKEPKVGAIVSLKGKIHAGVVTEVRPNTIVIKESNYIKNWIVSREVPKSAALGYVYY